MPLKNLETKFRAHIELFKTISSFAEALGGAISIQQINVRIEKLGELWEKVNETIMDIEMHADFDPEESAVKVVRLDFVN